jgi:curved DNA-binding protein CbpA
MISPFSANRYLHMTQSVDQYRILGVMRDAEQVVITASYRALASMYHPDRWKGDVNEATRKMAEINVAYGILGDPVKRRAYDQANQSTTSSMGADSEKVDEAFDAALVELESRWEVAVAVLPDLAVIRKRLSKTAHRLAFEFVVLMIESKKFDQRETIANDMERKFLVAHFGTQPDIIRFAKTLIEMGHRDAIRALNNYIEVLGTELDPHLIIKKVKNQFKLDSFKQHQESNQKIESLKREVEIHGHVNAAKQLAELSGFVIFSIGTGIFSFAAKYNLYKKSASGFPGEVPILEHVSPEQLVKWVKENLC